MPSRQDPLPYEQHIREFLAQRGTHDIDSQAAVFNLDHASMDVLSTMEGIALRPHELTHAGFVLLMTLWITGPRETRELASVLRVTKGAIVGAVNTLERRDLVRRIRSELDRRLVTVELTEEGDALISRVQRDWHALERAVTADLTTEEKRTLASLCRKMAFSARNLRLRSGSRLPALPDPDRFLANLNGENDPRSAPPRRMREYLGDTPTPPAEGLRPSALPTHRHSVVRNRDGAQASVSQTGRTKKSTTIVSQKADADKR